MNDNAKRSIEFSMRVLMDCRDYLLEHNKDYNSQKIIQHLNIRGYHVEIESPVIGGTDGDWIRLYYGDCYLYMYDDGTERYELDPIGGCGSELISTESHEDFLKQLNTLPDIEEYYYE